MKINTPNDLSYMIRDARKDLKLTQAQLAKKLGLFQKDISRIETDPSKVSLVSLLNVCAALNIKVLAERKFSTLTTSINDDQAKPRVLDF